MIRRLTAAASLLVLGAISISATRPPAKGVTYRLRMTSRVPQMMAQMQNGDASGPALLAKVKAVGKNARFELQAVPQGAPMSLEDYILFLESGRAILVNTAEKSYTEAPASLGGAGGPLGMLGSVAGRGGRSGGRQIEITGIDMALEQLDGDTLQGRQVRHYQLVAEMSIQVMNTMTPLRVEMETWTADVPYNIINPFDMLSTAATTGVPAADDPFAKLTARLIAERKKIQGTPLKTTMTMIISGLGNGAVPPLEFGQTTQITDIKEVEIDLKELEIPAGYTKKEPGTGRGGSGIR